MKTKPQYVQLVGPTSVGKGFNRKLSNRALSRIPGLLLGEIGIGDEVRDRCKADPEFKSTYQPMMDNGDLLPDPVVIDLYEKKHGLIGHQDVIFVDGFCRSEIQIDYAEKNGYLNKGDVVFIFNATIDVCMKRFLSRTKAHGKDRTDNEMKTFYKRYHDFEKVLPALRAMFLDSEAQVFEIDANPDIPEFVFPDFMSYLMMLLKKGQFASNVTGAVITA